MVKRIITNRLPGGQPKETCEDCGSATRGVLMFKKCPDCKSSRITTLAETGEKFCRACGLVLL
jgi:hypothetical protein